MDEFATKVRNLFNFQPESPHLHHEANQWLIQFQKSPQAWLTCAQILLTNFSGLDETNHIHFIAAQILQAKIRCHWESCETQTKQQIFEVLLQFAAASETKSTIVVRPVCSALAALAIQSGPGLWDAFFPTLFSSFGASQQGISCTPFQTQTILDIMGSIPKEITRVQWNQDGAIHLCGQAWALQWEAVVSMAAHAMEAAKSGLQSHDAAALCIGAFECLVAWAGCVVGCGNFAGDGESTTPTPDVWLDLSHLSSSGILEPILMYVFANGAPDRLFSIGIELLLEVLSTPSPTGQWAQTASPPEQARLQAKAVAVGQICTAILQQQDKVMHLINDSEWAADDPDFFSKGVCEVVVALLSNHGEVLWAHSGWYKDIGAIGGCGVLGPLILTLALRLTGHPQRFEVAESTLEMWYYPPKHLNQEQTGEAFKELLSIFFHQTRIPEALTERVWVQCFQLAYGEMEDDNLKNFLEYRRQTADALRGLILEWPLGKSTLEYYHGFFLNSQNCRDAESALFGLEVLAESLLDDEDEQEEEPSARCRLISPKGPEKSSEPVSQSHSSPNKIWDDIVFNVEAVIWNQEGMDFITLLTTCKFFKALLPYLAMTSHCLQTACAVRLIVRALQHCPPEFSAVQINLSTTLRLLVKECIQPLRQLPLDGELDLFAAILPLLIQCQSSMTSSQQSPLHLDIIESSCALCRSQDHVQGIFHHVLGPIQPYLQANENCSTVQQREKICQCLAQVSACLRGFSLFTDQSMTETVLGIWNGLSLCGWLQSQVHDQVLVNQACMLLLSDFPCLVPSLRLPCVQILECFFCQHRSPVQIDCLTKILLFQTGAIPIELAGKVCVWVNQIMGILCFQIYADETSDQITRTKALDMMKSKYWDVGSEQIDIQPDVDLMKSSFVFLKQFFNITTEPPDSSFERERAEYFIKFLQILCLVFDSHSKVLMIEDSKNLFKIVGSFLGSVFQSPMALRFDCAELIAAFNSIVAALMSCLGINQLPSSNIRWISDALFTLCIAKSTPDSLRVFTAEELRSQVKYYYCLKKHCTFEINQQAEHLAEIVLKCKHKHRFKATISELSLFCKGLKQNLF